jgi:hypothetical protein
MIMPDLDQREAPTADDLDEGQPAWDEELFSDEWQEGVSDAQVERVPYLP